MSLLSCIVVTPRDAPRSSVVSNQASLQTCLAVLAALDPTVLPVAHLKPDARLDLTRCTVHAVEEDATAGSPAAGSSAGATRGRSIPKDDPTRDFLARQLRLLMARESGQSASGQIGEGDHVAKCFFQPGTLILGSFDLKNDDSSSVMSSKRALRLSLSPSLSIEMQTHSACFDI